MKNTSLSLFIALSCVLIFLPQRSHATHVMGSDITYKCLSPYRYELTLNIYRDCRGIPVGALNLNVHCLGGSKRNLNLTRVSIEDITPVPKNAAKRCNPPNTGFGQKGVEKHVFRTILDLNDTSWSSFKNCDEIYLEFEECCRNGAITTGAGNQHFYSFASIVLKESNCNSSPEYLTDPVAFLCCDVATFLTPGGVDSKDHDSLVYSFADPLKGFNSSIGYNTGYHKDLPIDVYFPPRRRHPYNKPDANPPEGMYLDPGTGNMAFTPTDCNEVSVMVLQIDEYRKDSNGVAKRVGTVRRDMQVDIQRCPGNNPPKIKITNGPSNSRNIQTQAFTICKEGNTNICFDVETEDEQFAPPPPAPRGKLDTVTLRVLSKPPGSDFVFKDPSAREPKGRFCWSASDSFIRAWGFYRIYPIVFEARDDASPMNSISSHTVLVYFTPPTSVKSYVRGFVHSDEDANCSIDSVDVPASKAWVNYGKGIYTLTDEKGFYTTCLDTGNNHIRLDPSQWYKNCGDTVIRFMRDSVYNVNLFRTLAKGITGHVYSEAFCDTAVKSPAPLAGVKVIATPGNYVAATDANGRYVLKVPSGQNYKVQLLKNQPFVLNRACDTAYNVNVTKDSVYKYFNFAAIRAVDLNLEYISRLGSSLRWGKDAGFRLRLNNPNSNHAGNVRVRVKYDPNLTNLRFTGGNYTVVGPGEFTYIQQVDSWSANDFSFSLHVDTSRNKINDKILVTAFIDSFLAADNYSQTNDTLRYRFTVVASYDPNIKTTFNDSIFTPVNPWLDYNVTFQNTGNDVAYDVLVLDTLPPGLDYSTLEMKGATHAYTWSLDHNKLQVFFRNINLPDSASDPELSIGSFSFRIRIEDSTKSVQHFNNRAAIYFDINPPIFTPYHTNTYYSPTSIESPARNQYCIDEEIKLEFQGYYPIYHQNHQYTLELSEEGGSFDKPLKLMSMRTMSSEGSFVYRVHDSIPDGYYRFRVRGSYPDAVPFAGFETGLIQLNSSPIDTLVLSSTDLCDGESLQINSKNAFANKKLYINDVLVDSLGNYANWNIDTLKGSHQIHLKVSQSSTCFRSTDTLQVTLHPKPLPAFDADTFVCFKGHNIDLKNRSQNSRTYHLYSGDGRVFAKGASFSDTSLQYALAGNYRIALIAESDQSCKDSSFVNIRIAENPVVAIGSLPNDSCFSGPLSYTDLSQYPASGVANRSWDFGDGNSSNTANGNHLWNPGTYTVQLIANSQDGCADTASHTLTIHPTPQAQISLNKAVQCFDEQDIQLSDQSNMNGANLSIRRWDLGDGSGLRNDPSFNHTYSNEGDYSVQLYLLSDQGCEDSASTPITVAASPIADLEISKDKWCASEQPIHITFSGNAPATSTYIWTTGDGQTHSSRDLSHIYSSIGNFDIQLVVEVDGCTDTASTSVEILMSPEITDFSADQVCEGDETEIRWEIIPASEAFDIRLIWGDGKEENLVWPDNQSARQIYAAAGTYASVLNVNHSNGCATDSQINVAVHAMPAPSFTHQDLGGGRIRFSSGGQGNTILRSWDFGTTNGDQAEGNEVEFVYVENGTYTVRLDETSLQGCVATFSKDIEILFGEVFHIPNAFSPNKDGLNDEFQISNSFLIQELDIQLWNSWGQKVFEGSSISSPLSDFEAVSGQYVYLLTIRDINGKKYHFKGVLTVLP